MKIDIDRILCPTDFSESSVYALSYALAIAARHGATVELFHVTEISAYAHDPPLEGDSPGETFEDRLWGRLREMAESPGPDVAFPRGLVSGEPHF